MLRLPPCPHCGGSLLFVDAPPPTGWSRADGRRVECLACARPCRAHPRGAPPRIHLTPLTPLVADSALATATDAQQATARIVARYHREEARLRPRLPASSAS